MKPAAVPLLGAMLLAACGEPAALRPEGEADPAMTAALTLPLLVDPDLTSQSRRFALLSSPDPLAGELPSAAFSDAARNAARAEAARLAGGPVGPAAPAEDGACGSCAAPTLAARAQQLGRPCTARLAYDFAWGTKFDRELPLYPRAHLLDAAGRDEPGCATRAATFVAPVPAAEAVGFYAALGRLAGFALTRRRAGAIELLHGERRVDRAGFLVLAAPDQGGSRVDLIVAD